MALQCKVKPPSGRAHVILSHWLKCDKYVIPFSKMFSGKQYELITLAQYPEQFLSLLSLYLFLGWLSKNPAEKIVFPSYHFIPENSETKFTLTGNPSLSPS